MATPAQPDPAPAEIVPVVDKTAPEETIMAAGRPKSSLIWRLFNHVCRVAVWIVILTALFRCPDAIEDVTADSSRVCRPYLAVRSRVEPHVKPYYDQYLAEHVDLARPYISQVNRRLIEPAVLEIKTRYDEHAAPVVDRVARAAAAEWTDRAQPKVDAAVEWTETQYRLHLADHVTSVVRLAGPIVDGASKRARWTWTNAIMPSYEFMEPHAISGYVYTRTLVQSEVVPRARQVCNLVLGYLHRSVLPRLRGLYAEHVEPQLVRIQDHLVQSKEGKLSTSRTWHSTTTSLTRSLAESVSGVSADEKATSSRSSSSSLSLASSLSSTSTSSEAAPASTPNQVQGQAVPPSGGDSDGSAGAPSFSQDMTDWQIRFQQKRSELEKELEKKLADILVEQRNRASSGGIHAADLLVLSRKLELQKAQTAVDELVSGLAAYPSESEADETVKLVDEAVKSRVVAFRSRAVELRHWKRDFIDQTHKELAHELDETHAVLVDIRNLGLVDIGRRWANVDKTSLDEWRRYQALKNDDLSWRNETLATMLAHPEYDRTIAVARRVEKKILDTSETFIADIRSVRTAAVWKILTGSVPEDIAEREAPTFVPRQPEPSDDSPVEDVQETVAEDGDRIAGSETDETGRLISQLPDEAETITITQQVRVKAKMAGDGDDGGASIEPETVDAAEPASRSDILLL